MFVVTAAWFLCFVACLGQITKIVNKYINIRLECYRSRKLAPLLIPFVSGEHLEFQMTWIDYFNWKTSKSCFTFGISSISTIPIITNNLVILYYLSHSSGYIYLYTCVLCINEETIISHVWKQAISKEIENILNKNRFLGRKVILICSYSTKQC